MSELVHEYRLLIADVYELAGVSRRSSEREAADQGTTVARWHVLSTVSEQPLPVPAIARRLGQVRQGVQRVVDELTEVGQLRTEPNPAHRRSPLYALTPDGARLLEQLWTASESPRLTLLEDSGVNAEDLRRARDTLRRLSNAPNP
ncbi:MarR family winged helix-turn-helix transcriptional regulator [Amycolatopsis coloradensis]|nr:MarR family winged helix-turn-helix transcriptional regulator [Amycolatopsis coloradensis]